MRYVPTPCFMYGTLFARPQRAATLRELLAARADFAANPAGVKNAASLRSVSARLARAEEHAGDGVGNPRAAPGLLPPPSPEAKLLV